MNRLGFVCGALLIVCAICVIAQCLIQPTYDNVQASVIAGLGISSLALYLWISRPFDDAPLSTLALFGYCVTSEFAALVAQTLDGAEFVHYLRDPIYTFWILTAAQWVSIGTHYVYRKFEPVVSLRDWGAKTFLTPLGVHAVPKPMALWIFSFFGVLAMAQGGAGFGDASGKALQALEFMVWMPFLILVYQRRFGMAYTDSKTQIMWVAVYATGIFALAMAKNARGLMFIGPASLMLLYMVVAVRERGPMPAKSVMRVGVAMVLVAVSVVLLADLATAMTMVRGQRDDIKRMELLEETYRTMLDRAKIEAYRENIFLESKAQNFDENYISNPILNRLSETKFHDNMIYFSHALTDVDRDRVIEENLIKMVILLPQPVLDFLDMKIKKERYSYSMGDIYMQSAAGGELGGFVTGSIWADALVIFGPFWPLSIFCLLLLLFLQLDSLTRLDAGYFISPVGLCIAWTIFIYGIGGESYAVKVSFLLRDLPQKVFLYVLVLAPIRFFAPSLMCDRRQLQAASHPG